MVDREVALEHKCDTLVKSSVLHLPFVGQVGPGYEEKYPLLVSFPINVPSLMVEAIAYQVRTRKPKLSSLCSYLS